MEKVPIRGRISPSIGAQDCQGVGIAIAGTPWLPDFLEWIAVGVHVWCWYSL